MKHTMLSTVTALLPLMLMGCGGAQQHEKELEVKPEVLQQYIEGKPEPLQRLYARIPKEGDRNVVLNQNRIGLAAFQLGEYALAAEALDSSIAKVEAIYADNEAAEKARSVFFKENAKEYKGDAYERTMLYYYRGLTYMASGDYENARASFKAAMLQDSFAEEAEYRADFASIAFLEGWTSQCLADTAQATERYKEATTLNEHIVPPSSKDNLLVIYEAGAAPIKKRDDEQLEALVYERGTSPNVQQVGFMVNGKNTTLFAAEDVYWQAITRGGREIDKVLRGKADFKEGASAVGELSVATATTGVSMMNDFVAQGHEGAAGAAGVVSGVALLAGLVAKAAESSAQIDADIRYWDNLPNILYIATANVPYGTNSVQISKVENNQPSESYVKINWKNQCGLVWGRQVSSLSVADSAPNAVAE
ncbi:MAG: hypothetical protein EAY65_07100 [Alphaproteobacteria bacterium]|nr:MAG: hypothetical protein EAY65_07100 [Alphaproteobacteria bacterium]